MKLHIVVTCERPHDSKGPWPDEQRWNSKITQFKQVEFYADDDDTSATTIYEVNNDYDLYYLIIAALQFESTVQITVDTVKEN